MLIPLFISFSPCGIGDRWKIKTLQDSKVNQINFKPIDDLSIEDLMKLPTDHVGRKTERHGVEFNVYTVECDIREYFYEGDSNIHIVLTSQGDHNNTIIAEIPGYHCKKVAKSAYADKFKAVRNSFLLNIIDAHHVVGMHYRVTGVDFIDLKHSKPQKGAAPNAFELYPVLAIEQYGTM